MPITQLLERNADLYGQDVALVEVDPGRQGVSHDWKESPLMEPSADSFYRQEMTWRVFDEKANRFANLLISRGIGKGSKVAILLMNCLEWLPIYFGVLKSGALAVPMNFRYTADEIAYCADLAQADVLVFGDEFVERMSGIHAELSKKLVLIHEGTSCPQWAASYRELTANCSSARPGIALTDEDEAAIYFSSGTTGFPKAILHDHAALMHACRVEQQHHGQTRDDVFLCIPPLYHTGAKMHWFGSLLAGAKSILLKGTTPRWILTTASREKCTILWLLVPWAQDILGALDSGNLKKEDFSLDQLRLMHIGAQPVPKSLVRRWLDYFPNMQYDTNYGLSESIGPGCVHLGVENVHKVGAIGIPGWGWEVKIEDEGHVITAPNEVGELCVKGPGVMKCYFRNEEATAEVLKGGWLYTGDMAMYDEDGFIFLVDRKKDVIISGGENIYPVQIEDHLAAHPDVKDVAVIGLPDARLGEVTAAIVEIKPGHLCTEMDLQVFCDSLPRYKRPRHYIFADVPRNPTGKIEKPLLRRRYGGERLVEAQNES